MPVANVWQPVSSSVHVCFAMLGLLGSSLWLGPSSATMLGKPHTVSRSCCDSFCSYKNTGMWNVEPAKNGEDLYSNPRKDGKWKRDLPPLLT